MLISLVTLLAMALSAGIRASLAGGPVVMEGPPTLELAIISIVVIVAYAVATRIIWQRPASDRTKQAASEAIKVSRSEASAQEQPEEKPSRGAA